MFANIEAVLLSFVTVVPLEIFVFVASLIEEIIAPIPSPTVMVLSGSIAGAQDRLLLALIPLAIIGAVGKTLGALVVYTISDKAEDLVMNRFGRYFNVTHEDVEKFGAKLGTGLREYVYLTLFRAFPFMPSVVVSVGSGVLKIRLRVFIVSSFLGTIIRDGFYLYTGYAGFSILTRMVQQSSRMETCIEVLIAFAILLFVGYRVYSKKNA